jgi:hypothetical protein
MPCGPCPEDMGWVAGPDLGRALHRLYSPTAAMVNSVDEALLIRVQAETFGRQGGRPPQRAASRKASQRKRGEKSPCARGVNGLFGGPRPSEPPTPARAVRWRRSASSSEGGQQPCSIR